MGKIVQVDEGMPLQTYLIKYQKILHEEDDFKLRNLLEDESLHMSQLFTDSEITLTKYMKLISVEIKQRITGTEFNLIKKLDDVLNISQLIFEGLNRTISNVEDRMSTKLDNEVLKMKQECIDVDMNTTEKLNNKIINISRNLDDHIRNSTFVSEELNQAIIESDLNISKRLKDIEVKLNRKFDDEILNLKRELYAEIMITKNLTAEIKIIEDKIRSVLIVHFYQRIF